MARTHLLKGKNMFYCNNYESEAHLRNIIGGIAFFSKAEIDKIEVDSDSDKIFIYLYNSQNGA